MEKLIARSEQPLLSGCQHKQTLHASFPLSLARKQCRRRISLVKLGEITFTLDRDVKKDEKVSLSSIVSYSDRDKKDLAVSVEAKKGSKIKITVDTV